MYAWWLAIFFAANLASAVAQDAPKFHVLALAEEGGLHRPYVDAARVWLKQEAVRDDFSIDYVEDTSKIDSAFLAGYQLIIQLNYPPYNWTPTAMRAFESYIDEGRGGWIGFHHATLLGYFDGFDLWSWYSNFMGGIQFTDYIASFSSATVKVEDPASPIMQGLRKQFQIENEEWYTYNKSPRPHVHVLASVDESTYSPDSKLKMGDHPVVWTNDQVKARNVYIFMGHHPELFQNQAYTTLFHNAILWAAKQ